MAITGSNGKTSLKNTISFLLNKYDKTHCSPRSFNNHYGVPVSLSNLDVDDKYGIFEVGMSKAGEINQLSKIIKPDLALITNIGEAHIENFKNIQEIAKAKSEILNNIQKNGKVILNRDDKFFSSLNKKAKLKKIKVITFGKSKKSDVHLIKTKYVGEHKIVVISAKDEIIKLSINNINIYNVLSSIAILKEFNLDLNKVTQDFKSIQLSEGRGKVHRIRRYNKKFTLIDESYNANPFSVKNALNSFSKIKKNKFKKYVI